MTDFRATPETPDNGTGEAITMRLQLPMGPTVEEFWETMHEQMLNCAFMLSYGCKIPLDKIGEALAAAQDAPFTPEFRALLNAIDDEASTWDPAFRDKADG